ncbi:type IV pilus assembly protein PilM [Clostridium sartagoforme AAU1]|uniref:Type IV pilus assembly protein PilM n=1 Tax=Clostridium sartagoforme AAU1 TaxID=1202534 RepID=R9CFN7_9CLOT|nr:type IV pilus assembly protein PilM [Clostridium sartagoforme]EOR28098.1 type IV pilus assembly protein PilM [Clostridium sartagoforme AAU1]
MSQQNKKFDFSKLKDIGSMDIKDIGKLFKKDKSEDINSSYEVNKVEKKGRLKEKSRSVISIDLGTNFIKVAEGKYQKDKLSLNKVVQIPTPEGCITDGKIINAQAIIDVLSFLIKENSIRAKDVIFTTNSSSIINRDILIPIVQEEEMETVIRYEIQQYLPINLDDYIIQFIVLDEIVDDTGAKLKINVTSFPERMANTYYNVINALELNPYALDVTYNSINKLANYSQYTSKNGQTIGGTVAFVDMGATSINVAIFKNGKLDFTRMIKSGGDNIDYALSQSLNMSIKSTESLKIKDGDLLKDNEEDVLNLTIRKSVDDILEELERILQFYSNKSNTTINKIYIYGGTSNLKHIDIYVKNKINISVDKIEDIPNIDFTSKDLINENLGQYLNAISAIIRL